jgi:hypothetical protein
MVAFTVLRAVLNLAATPKGMMGEQKKSLGKIEGTSESQS